MLICDISPTYLKKTKISYTQKIPAKQDYLATSQAAMYDLTIMKKVQFRFTSRAKQLLLG